MLSLQNKIGLIQEQLGQYVGVSGRAVSEWETGNSSPRTERLKVLPTVNSFRARYSSNGSLPCIMLVRIYGGQYLDTPAERAQINPGNPYILPAHLLCAAIETPLTQADAA